MTTPNLYTPEAILENCPNMQTYVNERWVPLRPLGYRGPCVLRRLKLAWNVFIGRYDVLDWEQNVKEIQQ